MNKQFLFYYAFLLLCACNTKQENRVIDKTISQDTLAALEVTIIANLPDSLQPKAIALSTRPKPKVTPIPKNSVETKMLPVLQNEKGEPILDAEGQPFFMGDGGKSNFTNFSTDDGLPIDGISCSLMDKKGNLWFGTYGGGVSRYDGKSFTNFSTDQGLANSSILSVLEDKDGNLWFGTYGGGLSRYDGQSFTNFSTDQGLINNDVSSILEDEIGNLWFGTFGGVSRYDGKTFNNFTTDQGLANNGVMSMLEDKNGNLWFGTGSGGVSKYDGNTFTIFTTDQGLAYNSVVSMLEDKNGNLWFGTHGGGVSKYNGKSFTNFTTNHGLAYNMVWNILEDKAGNLWFGTFGGGVSRYDGNAFTTFRTTQGLSNNDVLSILEDKIGNLWFGTYGGGVSRYDGKSFATFTTDHGLKNSDIRSILEDKNGNLWFGTRDGGMSQYDGKSFKRFTTKQWLVDNGVYSMLEDKNGNLWFGTDGGGVSKYDGNSFTTFNRTQGLAGTGVVSMLEDKKGNLWFGSQSDGVCKFDGKFFTNFTTDHGLVYNGVSSILEDKNGNLWFGTEGGGVSKYDGKSFTNFTIDQGLANNEVYRILEDKNGNLWFATAGGVSFLSKERWKNLAGKSDKDEHKDKVSAKIFKNFSISDGLPDNFVTEVIQLPSGKMAVGTNLGITLFNLTEDFTKLTNIEIYNTKTGYPVKDVNVGGNCLLMDSKGIIWAGTGSEKTALVRFDYTALHKDQSPPTLVIQAVKVREENICWYDLQTKGVRINKQDSATARLQEFLAYGKTLIPSENEAILKRFGNIQFDSIRNFYPIPENLVLPYEHNQISFEFAAIETDRPFLVNYQYKLDGYDTDWSPITKRSNASFGNINGGIYTFHLKAQGANGVWSEPTSYTFQVLPPWYQTWWAYLLFFSLFSAGIYRVYQFQLKRALTLQEAEKIASLDQAKTQLYTNITHEFRTPLTVIIGMTKRLETYLQTIKGNEAQGTINIIYRNSHQLLGLINQMLNLSKLESKTMPLNMEQGDIVTYLKYLFQSYESLAETQQIQMHFLQEMDVCIMDFDPEKIRMLLANLLSNAIKYNQAGGAVTLSLQQTKAQHLLIAIKDTGIGISKENLPYIFDRFYQTDSSASRRVEGTGIGLALTKELVELLGGTISVTSTLDKETNFSVLLPITKKAQLIKNSALLQEQIDKEKKKLAVLPIGPLSPIEPSNSEQYKVLIVEDNADVATYIKSCLETAYQLYFAQNGQEGIDQALELIPDIIISDVMMPLKDGFELCQTLKKAEETSHIPIILLTAKATLEDKIAGLEYGADAYLTKPFYPKELAVRLEKLIENRQHLQAKYSQGILIANPAPKTEEVFLQKIQEIILKNLDQSDWSSNDLPAALGTSRTQLHLKIKALTGISTANYINKIRLQEASKLLRTTDLTIAEVAYRVGYSTPQYFARLFSKEFGQSPRAFRA